MKRTLIYIVLAALLSGCFKEPLAGSLELSVRLQLEPMPTRAYSQGVDALGENAISSADVFLFGDGGRLLMRSSALEPAGGVIRCPVAADVVRGESSFRVVVAANAALPSTGLDSEQDVLSAMVDVPYGTDSAPYRFVMYGASSAALGDSGLNAIVPLYRSAAKVELRITDVASSAESGGESYVPDLGHMYVTFRNGAGRGALGGLAYLASAPAASTFFERSEGPLVQRTSGDSSYYTTAEPLYSMASSWLSDQTVEASLLLVVPWSSDGGANWKRSYYQIPVNAAGMKMEQNTHYVINMSIGIVGSFEEIAPVTLQPSLVMQPWGEFLSAENNVLESRYLVLGSTALTLSNQTSASIQFASSHECSILSQEMTHADLSDKDAPDIVVDPSQYTLTLDNDAGIISFSHALDNSGGVDSDFAPYVLTFVVGHADNANYTQVVTIEQHPMIAVVAQLNTDGEGSAHNGYVYINNGSKSSLGGGGNGLSGSNKNPSMYVISLTAFAEGSTYTIGDPRLPYIDNLPGYSGSSLSYTWAQSANAIEGGTRRIAYYHPTESSSRTVNMVTPKFRVASSYGACQSASYNNMQRRCASYQEDGYPAGRWRLPTAAEILYIMSLSDQGTIPELFTIGTNDTNGYWCANGWVGGDAQGNPVLHESFSGSNYVRCVYDDWYWGSEQAVTLSQFTWGDVND